ncbi:MAG: phage/plasmid primase, P4 family [Pseudomonadota bacterium]
MSATKKTAPEVGQLKRGITLYGDDFAELLTLLDTRTMDLNLDEMSEFISVLSNAAAGVPRARSMTLRAMRLWFQANGVDLSGDEGHHFEAFFAQYWDEPEDPRDVRDFVRGLIEKVRRDALTLEMSDSSDQAVVEDDLAVFERSSQKLEDWLQRPRADCIEDIEAAIARERTEKTWPRQIDYPDTHDAKNAHRFMRLRPKKLLSFDGDLYSFDENHWAKRAEQEIRAEVRATNPVESTRGPIEGDAKRTVLTATQVGNLIRSVHDETCCRVGPFEWIEPKLGDPEAVDMALFANGLLDVTAMELLPHDGRYFATGLPEYDWDPLAECPSWKRWLDQTLDSSFHDTLQEWFGYCLTPDTSAHKFMTLVGVKRSGKSTALEVLSKLVGEQHVAAASMQTLANEFGAQAFIGKRLAIVGDARDVEARGRTAAIERLLNITGEDTLSINQKNKDIVSVKLRTRLTIACNDHLSLLDESQALAARMLIVRFERSFLGKEDRGLSKRLMAELPGIANWALEGLERLRSNGGRFSVGALGESEVRKVAMAHAPALRFAEDCLEIGEAEDFVLLDEVYEAFSNWAYAEDIPRSLVRGKWRFAQDLESAVDGVKFSQRRVEGKSPRVLSGIRGVIP